MTGALTVGTFPANPVRIVCQRCGRAGRYRRETLAARYGVDAKMPDVLRAVADCPKANTFGDSCAVIYADLKSA